MGKNLFNIHKFAYGWYTTLSVNNVTAKNPQEYPEGSSTVPRGVPDPSPTTTMHLTSPLGRSSRPSAKPGQGDGEYLGIAFPSDSAESTILYTRGSNPLAIRSSIDIIVEVLAW